jgi:hypothetical protein
LIQSFIHSIIHSIFSNIKKSDNKNQMIDHYILFDQAMDVDLVGPYHGDSYGGGGTHTIACGWPGLKVEDIKHGRAAPYMVCQDGEAIGWAPESSIRRK